MSLIAVGQTKGAHLSPEQKVADGPSSPYSTPPNSAATMLESKNTATKARRSTRLVKIGKMEPRALAAMDVAADNKEDAGEDADEESDGMEYEPALTRPSAATAAAAADAGALPGGAAATAAGGLKPTGEDPSMFDAAATLASLFGGSGSEESDGTASPASSPTRKNAPASGLAPASAPLSHAGANGDGDGDGDGDGPPSAKRHKAAAKSPSSSTSSRRRAGAGSHRRTAASSGGSAAASSPAPTPAGSSKRKSAPTAARMSKSPSSSPKRRGPSAKPVLGAKKLNGKNGSAAAPPAPAPAPAHAQAPAPASATAAAANTPTQLSSHPPSSPMARSPTTPHPPIGLPQGCIRVTTFQTRSRDETRALQAEAEVLNKRYIPPGRPVFQCFAAPKVPPTAPVDVEDANLYPFIRIGDTVELNFAMKTPFDLMCKGSQIEPNGQTALGFQCTDSKKAAILSLEFQIFYYSFDDGVVCLRCQKAPGACACNYASDLLEINRDWKAKRDPQRRLGLKEHSDGTCSIAIRVPRTRRKVSKADKEAGVQQSDRPNTWNSKLRQLSPKDPKVIAIKMIEKRTLLTGAKTSTTLAEHLSFTRLVAKNGGQLASGTARRGRASVSPTAVARGHDSAGSAKSGSGGAAKNAKARRNCAGTASGGVASVSKGGGNSSSSSRRRSSSVPPASPVAAVAAGKAKPKSKPKPKPRALPKAVSPAAETPAATQSPMARASVAHDFAHLDAAAAAATAAAITAQAAAAAATAHALRQVAAAADAAKAAAEAAPAGMQPSFALAGSPIRTGVGADGMAALSGYSSSPLALAMSAAMSAAAVATTPPFHHQAAAAGAGAAAAASASAVPAALAALMAHENTPEAVSPARSEGASSSDDGNDGAMSRRNRAKRKLKWASAADSTDST